MYAIRRNRSPVAKARKPKLSSKQLNTIRGNMLDAGVVYEEDTRAASTDDVAVVVADSDKPEGDAADTKEGVWVDEEGASILAPGSPTANLRE